MRGVPPAHGPRGSHELSAAVGVIHQDLQLRAYVEVTPADGDLGAACCGAHGRLQRVDLGQLGGEAGGQAGYQAGMAVSSVSRAPYHIREALP